MIVDALVEGPSDESVARKLITFAGHECGTIYGKRGWPYLREKASGFNIRARYGNPILMLVDFMDTGSGCPPAVGSTWLPNPCDKMLLRVVVRELESWLLADATGLAHFFGISNTIIPRNPEEIVDPKQTLINLARRSRRRVCQAIVPAPGVSASIGPGYVAAIDQFVTEHWNVQTALLRSPSLHRCLLRLQKL